jgi:hypothetical protein
LRLRNFRREVHDPRRMAELGSAFERVAGAIETGQAPELTDAAIVAPVLRILARIRAAGDGITITQALIEAATPDPLTSMGALMARCAEGERLH